jgi:hypothetical protein
MRAFEPLYVEVLYPAVGTTDYLYMAYPVYTLNVLQEV